MLKSSMNKHKEGWKLVSFAPHTMEATNETSEFSSVHIPETIKSNFSWVAAACKKRNH